MHPECAFRAPEWQEYSPIFLTMWKMKVLKYLKAVAGYIHSESPIPLDEGKDPSRRPTGQTCQNPPALRIATWVSHPHFLPQWQSRPPGHPGSSGAPVGSLVQWDPMDFSLCEAMEREQENKVNYYNRTQKPCTSTFVLSLTHILLE